MVVGYPGSDTVLAYATTKVWLRGYIDVQVDRMLVRDSRRGFVSLQGWGSHFGM